jgi:LysM repeat protein
VQKNDTVASIANSIGVSTIEIVNLNSFLGKPLLQRGKTGDNILIKLGQDIFIPKDKEIFKNHIDRIDEYTKVDKLNQQVLAGKKDAIAIEPIFASSVQSIGLPNILSGFIQSQQISYDPNHPRVVDRQWQTQVTCANAMRTLMGQSMNIVDLSPKEQVFHRKQNVDAWMLPTELIIIGYGQQFGEIMEMFDSRSVGSAYPIKKERLSEYRQAIRGMNNYLEKNGDTAVGSFVPYYFKRSHYKEVVAEYNRSRKDKHYNTHQSMFAGNATMQFGAWNVPLIRDGKMESFGMEKKSIVIEMGQKQNEKLNVRTDSLTPLQRILKSSDSVNNLEI